MLDYSILMPGGILDLEPRAPLTKDDFGGLDAALDPYLSSHDKLRGVLIHSKALPGWEDFDALAAHMRFVLEYQAKVERVAVATDSPLAGLVESLRKHSVSPK